jgi:hypothetical protein
LCAERFGRLRTIGVRMILFAAVMVAGSVVRSPTGTVA